MHACPHGGFAVPRSLLLPIYVVLTWQSALRPFVFADRPCVQFDVAHAAAVDDVSTVEFTTSNPNEKLIRIHLPISSLVRLGSEESLLQYLYVITGTSGSPFQILDYAPKTTLSTDVEGSISIEQNRGNGTNVAINARVLHDFPFKADASAGVTESASDSHRLHKLPSLQLLAASGTMNRGTSAYFKLKPSTRTTLEGDKAFEIVARVSRNWRAGLLYVNCAAYSRRTGFTIGREDESLVCGSTGFVVGLYLAGDAQAKQSVLKLVEARRQLQRLAFEHADAVDDERFPSVGHKIGAVFSIVKPRIPARWLDELLLTNGTHQFERYLPQKLRLATSEYREAKRQVIGQAG